MYRSILPFLILLTGCFPSTPKDDGGLSDSESTAVLQTEIFSFDVDGNTLVGLLDSPVGRDPMSTIILVHGYGETNVVEGNGFYELRSQFARVGVNTLVWDKPGLGQSEGEFDINQPVASSADEVVAAVRALKEQKIKGSETVGVWGVSRAGWIAPLAMQQESDIAFWISVSGTDDKENARYLLESNFRLEGRSEQETEVLIAEWQARFNTAWQNGTYEQYLAAAPNLKNDAFMHFMGWGGDVSEEDFYAYQDLFRTGTFIVDEEEGLQIYVPGFREVLGSIDRPMLAVFGEKDTNVDWRKTAALYRETIGTNPAASLTINVFPNADHNLKQTETGGIREMYAQPGGMPLAEGYYEAMLAWLVEQQFGEWPVSN